MFNPSFIIILGAGAIGTALTEAILQRYTDARVLLCFRKNKPVLDDARLQFFNLDATQESEFEKLAEFISGELADIKVDCIINTIGMLHEERSSLLPEKRLQDFSVEHFQKIINSNVLPTVLAAKHLACFFRKDKLSVFASLSARVGSISDNRLGGWHSYRSSKSCLNMMIKNIAIEWAYKFPSVCVLALHPGTTDSALSKPFQKNVPDGKLFSPSRCANYLLDVIATKRREDSGAFFDWNDRAIEW